MTALWALFLLCLVLGNAKKNRLDPLSSSGGSGPRSDQQEEEGQEQEKVSGSSTLTRHHMRNY